MSLFLAAAPPVVPATTDLGGIVITIVTALVSSAAFGGVASFFLKAFVDARLEKLKQVYRAETDAALEHLKTELRAEAYEREIRFSRLHDRRLDALAELYKLNLTYVGSSNCCERDWLDRGRENVRVATTGDG